MKNIWDVVNENAYGYYQGAIEESYDAVTDAPETISDFIGECCTTMVAIEAAAAQAEGVYCVESLFAESNQDAAALENASVVYEGLLSDAWEGLKELLRKAWEAIKAFLSKWWEKFKQQMQIIKGSLLRYDDVLRDKDCTGLEVPWIAMDFEAVMKHRNTFLNQIDKLYARLDRAMVSAIAFDSKARAISRTMTRSETLGRIAGRMERSSTATDVDRALKDYDDDFNRTIGKHQYRNELMDAMYHNHGQAPTPEDVSFNDIRRDALTAVDDFSSTQKYVQDFLRICESNENDIIQRVEKAEREMNKLTRSNVNGVSTAGARSAYLNRIRGYYSRTARAQVNYINICAQVMTNGCRIMRSQSVHALKMAIRYNPDRSGYYAEGKGEYAQESGLGGLVASII